MDTQPSEQVKITDTSRATSMHPCIVCRTLIDSDASMCPTCKSYQKQPWKNSLSYFGTTVGAIAIVVSAATFISGQVRDWYLSATWKDSVAPVYFEYPGDGGFINSGDGDVVISSVDVTFDDANRRTITIPINQQVPKGGFLVVHTKSPFDRPKHAEVAPWAKNKDGTLKAPLLTEALRVTVADRCAEFHVFNSGHLVFQRIDTLDPGRHLIEGPVTANLNYVSLHSGTSASIPLTDMRVAFLYTPNRPACTDEAFGIEPP